MFSSPSLLQAAMVRRGESVRVGCSAVERRLDQRRVDDTWRLLNLVAQHLPKHPRAEFITYMNRKNYISSLSDISDLRSQKCEIPNLTSEISCHRPIRLALRLASVIIFAASFAVGATNPSDANPDRGASRARAVLAKSLAVEPAVSAQFNYKWNVDNRQFPLLSFFSEYLKPGLDQSLSYPMDQFRFLIFETLDYDDARARYFLPSISGDGKGVHSIEFEPTQTKNNFVSIDEKKLKLIDDGSQKIIRASDGTRYVFVRYPDGEFHCAGIRDAGNNQLNFIYTSNGSMLHGVVDSDRKRTRLNSSHRC